MAAGSSCNCAAAINVFNCAELVALAMAAVTLGRAISHASATDAGVLRWDAATSSNARRILSPRGVRYFPTIPPLAAPLRSDGERYLPARNPLASEKYVITPIDRSTHTVSSPVS
jgi:hypothetical protein